MGKVLQPPSGGCVLKQRHPPLTPSLCKQPPSGGCVLKPELEVSQKRTALAAAFGRLCVETDKTAFAGDTYGEQPPSGGCVLKPRPGVVAIPVIWAAAFGRLCVETL